VVELEHEAHMPVAERDDVGVAHPGELGAVDGNAALIDAIEAAQHVQQRAFPHAGGTDNRHHLARVHGQIEIAKHGQRTAADRVALDEAPGF